MKIEQNYIPLIRVNAPELYQDPDFQRWLNHSERNQATWHQKGNAPGEYSDLFMTVETEGRDGSDSDMPGHCWQRLLDALADAGIEGECLVWISNLGGA